MALATNDLAWVRAEIGDTTPPTDATLNDIYDRLLNRIQVAIEVLSKRRADFIANAAQFVIPGEYGENHAKNIEALDKQIAYLRALPGAGDDPNGIGFGAGTGVFTLTRAESSR